MNKCKNINGIIIFLKSFKRIKVIGHLSTHLGYLFIYLFWGGWGEGITIYPSIGTFKSLSFLLK